MKRSRQINLDVMRKTASVPSVKILTAAIGGVIALTACSSNTQEAKIYRTLQECKQQNVEKAESCDAAYQHALKASTRTAPKYRSEYDCESEFGRNGCQVNQASGSSWFMPTMAGFMLGQALTRNNSCPYGYYNTRWGCHASQPVYTGSGSMYGGWYGADGTHYGSTRSRTARVGSKAFKPKPTATRTMSRGGFGSTVAAKSWSSRASSSSRSWGG